MYWKEREAPDLLDQIASHLAISERKKNNDSRNTAFDAEKSYRRDGEAYHISVRRKGNLPLDQKDETQFALMLTSEYIGEVVSELSS
jgi:hypothetical protein